MPRSDARQNLIDSVSCATAGFVPPFISVNEVAVCFGGKLMRGNRVRKVSRLFIQRLDSPAKFPGSGASRRRHRFQSSVVVRRKKKKSISRDLS